MRRGAFVLATLLAGVAAGAQAPSRPGSVDIRLAGRSSNSIHVEEQYVLGPGAHSLVLRVMTRPCVEIENLRIALESGRALALEEAHNGPWITWRDTAPPRGDSRRLVVRYDAWLGGSGKVPLVHLAAPLAGQDSSREGAVTISMRFSRADGEVEFPHMTRQAPTEWSGRYVATPSFVTVGRPTYICDLPTVVPRDNGGLVWRYWLLVGIMVAWVPVYLLWARHTGEQP